MCFIRLIFSIFLVCCSALKEDYKELRSCTFKGSVADPNDCTSYYHCEEGKLFHYHCGSSSAFDDSIKTCVSPPNDLSCSPVGTTEEPKENSLEDYKDTYICQQDGYFPDPTDCRRFYRCSKHSKHAFSCPLGLGFDSIKITCDPIEKIQNCGFGKRVRVQDAKEGPSLPKIKTASRKVKHISPAKYNQPKQNYKSPKKALNQKLKPPAEDLFYFWNFDGMADFDDYISLEEAAKMDYKMPPGFRDFTYDNNKQWFPPASRAPSSGTIPVGFPNKNSNNILQNNLPESIRLNTKLEPKQGPNDVEYGTFNPWNIPLRQSSAKEDTMQMAFDWKQATNNNFGSNNKNQFRKRRLNIKKQMKDANKNIYQNQNTHLDYKPERLTGSKPTLPIPSKAKEGRTNANELLRGDKQYSSIEIAYNSPVSLKTNREMPKTIAAQQIQYATTGRAAYIPSYQQSPPQQSYMPAYRRRTVSPNFLPYDEADPFHCPHDGYFRDNKDCTRFYHCTHGLPYLVKCNGGLYFNPANKICDWPARVPGCSSGMRKVFVSSQRLRLNDVANIEEQDEAEIPSMTEDGSPKTQEPNREEQKPKSKMAYFSKKGHQVDKVNTDTLENNKKPTGIDDQKLSKQHIMKMEKEVNVNDNLKESEDPKIKRHPDIKSYSPDAIHGVANIVDNDCKESGYFRHATDCSVFYKCTSNAKIEYKCEKGTAFHKKLKACVNEGYVQDC